MLAAAKMLIGVFLLFKNESAMPYDYVVSEERQYPCSITKLRFLCFVLFFVLFCSFVYLFVCFVLLGFFCASFLRQGGHQYI